MIHFPQPFSGSRPCRFHRSLRFVVPCLSLIAAFVFFGSSASAVLPSLTRIGQWGGSCWSEKIAGNRLYVGVGPRMRVFDISTPLRPVFDGEFLVSGLIEEIVVEGNLTYLGTEGFGLHIVDVTHPENPLAIGSLPITNGVRGLAVRGNIACTVGIGHPNFNVIDVSNPTSPALVSSIEIGGLSSGVLIRGNYAYALGSVGFTVIDISQPSAPFVVNNIQVPGIESNYAAVGDLLYMACNTSGMQIVSIADPIHPVVVGHFYDGSGFTEGVTVEGDRAYMTHSSNGLTILDISNPTSPQRLGSFPTSVLRDGWRVAVRGNAAYFIDQQRGLHLIDVTDPAMPTEIGLVDASERVDSVAVSGQFAYTSSIFNGLSVIDVHNAANLGRVGWCPTQSSVHSLAAQGQYVYSAENSIGGAIYDVSNPSAPVFRTTLPTGLFSPWGEHILVEGSTAFLTEQSNGLFIFSISNPLAPVRLSNFRPQGSLYCTSTALSGPYAYTTGNSTIVRAVDVSVPAAPQQVGIIHASCQPLRFQVAGGYAYFPCAGNGFFTFDVTDLQTPVLVSELHTTGQEASVLRHGDFLILTDNWSGTLLVNARDVAHQEIVLAAPADGGAGDFVLRGDLLYVTHGKGGLATFRLTIPGDANCDGTVNMADVPLFVLALLAPESYAMNHPDCGLSDIDLNADGMPNAGDISGLISLLLGN